MSMIDWDDDEPDWATLAKRMATMPAKPPIEGPRELTRWERLNPLPSVLNAKTAKSVGVFAGLQAVYDVVASGRHIPWMWAIPLSYGIAVGIPLVVSTAKQAIEAKADWSKAGELAKANIMVPVTQIKQVASVAFAAAMLPMLFGAVGLSKATKSAWASNLVNRLGALDVVGRITNSHDELQEARLNVAAEAGERAAWEFAHERLGKAQKSNFNPESAAIVFIKTPFDPRWPIGEHLLPLDQALERALPDIEDLEPDDREFLVEVIDLSRALREAIELQVVKNDAKQAREQSAGVSAPKKSRKDAVAQTAPASMELAPKRRAARL